MLPISKEVYRTSSLLRAIGNPIRVRIITLLEKHEMNVNEITEAIGVNQPNVSRHLRRLLRIGIVRRRKFYNMAYFSLVETRALDIVNKAQLLSHDCQEL